MRTIQPLQFGQVTEGNIIRDMHDHTHEWRTREFCDSLIKGMVLNGTVKLHGGITDMIEQMVNDSLEHEHPWTYTLNKGLVVAQVGGDGVVLAFSYDGRWGGLIELVLA